MSRFLAILIAVICVVRVKSDGCRPSCQNSGILSDGSNCAEKCCCCESGFEPTMYNRDCEICPAGKYLKKGTKLTEARCASVSRQRGRDFPLTTCQCEAGKYAPDKGSSTCLTVLETLHMPSVLISCP